jgi:hypothetical protein
LAAIAASGIAAAPAGAAGVVPFGKAVHDGEIRVESDTLAPDGVAGYEALATLASLIRSGG